MIKMYNAEVLSKFPVVQHFPFGSLFTWERDPNAVIAAASVHTASQPSNQQPSMATATGRPSENAHAPWARTSTHANDARGAAQKSTASHSDMPATRAPWATAPVSQEPANSNLSSRGMPDASTRAPWAAASGAHQELPQRGLPDGPTRAPWAKR